MKTTSPIPFLFTKNITQYVPVYKRINLHGMVLMGVLCALEKGLINAYVSYAACY